MKVNERKEMKKILDFHAPDRILRGAAHDTQVQNKMLQEYLFVKKQEMGGTG